MFISAHIRGNYIVHMTKIQCITHAWSTLFIPKKEFYANFVSVTKCYKRETCSVIQSSQAQLEQLNCLQIPLVDCYGKAEKYIERNKQAVILEQHWLGILNVAFECFQPFSTNGTCTYRGSQTIRVSHLIHIKLA